MTDQHDAQVKPPSLDQTFLHLFANYEREKAAFVEAAPDATQFNLPDEAYDLLCVASKAMDTMMRMEAPSMFALSMKLQALAQSPFPWNSQYSDFEARLTADASILSLQFAEIWLGRWTGHGGSVVVSEKGVGAWLPCFSLSVDAANLKRLQEKSGVTGKQAEEQRSWHQTFYDGWMRALADLLDGVPGTRLAVQAIVAENPERGLPANLEEQKATLS